MSQQLMLSVLLTKILHSDINNHSFKTHYLSASTVSGIMGDAKMDRNTNIRYKIGCERLDHRAAGQT